MDAVRTTDSRFASLPDFPWQPQYADVGDGLRMAYLDEGPRDAQPVLMLHGEPSWSFLYRKVVPPVLDAGYRVVVPDLIGFGRSDKPTRVADFTYQRHMDWLGALVLQHLDLRDVVLLCQDWGGLLGLRMVGEQPERFAAVCAANTGLPDGTRRLPDTWWAFHDFVQRTPDLPIGFLVQSGCATPPPPEVVAAYDAPFDSVESKAGARAFPGLIPQTLDDPATPAVQAAWEGLARFDRPFLTAFSDSDPITAGGERWLQERIPGAQGQPHTTIAGGGHFLQEDRGEELGRVLVDWLSGLARATG